MLFCNQQEVWVGAGRFGLPTACAQGEKSIQRLHRAYGTTLSSCFWVYTEARN
jgi:hypothetical protein